MANNLPDDIVETLVAYLDGELNQEALAQTNQLLKEQPALQERLNTLKVAKAAIKSAGNRTQIENIHAQFLHNRKLKAQQVPVRKMFSFKPLLRVAAVVIFVLVGASVYEYRTTSNESIFAANYTEYSIPVLRGNEQQSLMEKAFQAKEYNSVINIFDAIAVKSQKDYFLVGLALLQKGDAVSAIKYFMEIKKLNGISEEKPYDYETDFYLAMAFLKTGDVDKFQEGLNQILSNPSHPYYQKAKDIKRWQLSILKWKN